MSHRIVVYSPQVYENYLLQSGEGLSVLFVVIWLLGDLTNLIGAILAGLLPTVIILALYVSSVRYCVSKRLSNSGSKYTTCDTILFCQIYYYRWKRAWLVAHSDFGSSTPEEQVPLLTNENQRVDDIVPAWLLVIRYFCALAFVVIVGVSAWWVANNEEESGFVNTHREEKWLFIQLLGWSSASLFVRLITFPSATILISFPL